MAGIPHLSEADVKKILGDDDLEVVQTSESRIACSGSGGALGHPKTYYTIGDEGYVTCGYCDRIFVLGSK